jgi:PASTA domain-containing protein
MSNENVNHNLTRKDEGSANLALVYLLVMLGFFTWLLFDTWINAHTLFHVVGYAADKLTLLETPIYHLVAYTVIGGAIGGIVNGIRSVLLYYSNFQRRYFWKYIAAPWMGAALAIIGFALLHSTVAIFGGEATNATGNTPQFLANFGIGALAGYGSKDVFIWLDEQVGKLFAVEKPTPNVTGQPEAIAESQLNAQNLTRGEAVPTPAETPAEEGIVMDQAPAPGTPIASGQPVDLVVGAKPNGNGDQPHSDN